jgi:hypothetical protein
MSEETDANLKIESQLRSRLMANYSVQTPAPSAKAFVQLFLSQLVNVDTAEQTFSIHGWWRLKWVDQRLSWDSNLWNITEVVFDYDEIWKPDDYIYETISEVTTRSAGSAVVVKSNGCLPSPLLKCALHASRGPRRPQ